MRDQVTSLELVMQDKFLKNPLCFSLYMVSPASLIIVVRRSAGRGRAFPQVSVAAGDSSCFLYLPSESNQALLDLASEAVTKVRVSKCHDPSSSHA